MPTAEVFIFLLKAFGRRDYPTEQGFIPSFRRRGRPRRQHCDATEHSARPGVVSQTNSVSLHPRNIDIPDRRTVYLETEVFAPWCSAGSVSARWKTANISFLQLKDDGFGCSMKKLKRL